MEFPKLKKITFKEVSIELVRFMMDTNIHQLEDLILDVKPNGSKLFTYDFFTDFIKKVSHSLNHLEIFTLKFKDGSDKNPIERSEDGKIKKTSSFPHLKTLTIKGTSLPIFEFLCQGDYPNLSRFCNHDASMKYDPFDSWHFHRIVIDNQKRTEGQNKEVSAMNKNVQSEILQDCTRHFPDVKRFLFNLFLQIGRIAPS